MTFERTPTSKIPAALDMSSWDVKAFLEKVTGVVPSVIYVFNHVTQSNEYANQSLGATLGYEASELQDMGPDLVTEIMHPEDVDRIRDHFMRIRDMGDLDVATLAYRVRHKDGHWVWLLSYDTVFERDDAGAVVRHVGIGADITAHVLAEETALAEKRSAHAATEELRSFAYSISHDMKAPSNTLTLLLSELRDQYGEDLRPEASELVHLSLETVGRMRDLVDDVLRYTQVIGQELQTEDIDMHDLMEEILRDLHGEITQSHARVDIDPLPVVHGNRMQMRILFQNLINNGLKYHKVGTRPTVRVMNTTKPSDILKSITVKDNGIGIPKESQERIFAMFKRLHLSDEYPGTGLGLAICRRIVFAHGGDIKVDSKPGAGAAFTVTLA